MYKELKKLLHDTLKRGNCYAWDKVTTFFSFCVIVIMAFLEFLPTFNIRGHVINFEINEYVFSNFTIIALGGGIASLVKNKIASNKKENEE